MVYTAVNGNRIQLEEQMTSSKLLPKGDNHMLHFENKKHDWGLFKQIFSAFLASLSSVNIGFISAYSSLTLPQLRNETTIDFDDVRDSGWVAALPSISSLAGSLAGGFLMDAIGPRMCLVITSIPCILSWGFIGFANSIFLIYVGRFLTGIFLGIYSPVPQVYATEIAEPRIRGLMGAIPEAAVALGSLLCYVFGALMDWRHLAIASSLVPGIPLFISTVLLPESPQWLTKKNKLIQAKKSLEKKHNWKPVFMVFLVFMCGQFSGFAVVTAYTADIFIRADTGFDAYTSTIIVGLLRFISTIVSALLLDRTGRRPLLVISAIGSSMGMMAIGVFFYLQENSNVKNLSLLPLASLLIYVFFNELGYGPIPWLLSGEMIPLAVRAIGNGMAVTAYSLFAFLIGLTFPYLTDVLHDYGTFFLYAIFSMSGVILASYLPETRGKTLEDIERFFHPQTQPILKHKSIDERY